MNSLPCTLIKSFLPPFYCHVTSFARPSAGLTISNHFHQGRRPGDEAGYTAIDGQFNFGKGSQLKV